MAREIPTWLDSTPDGKVPSPPVATRAQGLPFNELTWQNFERLVLRLVRRKGRILDCVLYGMRGQAQGGIDVLAAQMDDATSRACYQCKKVERFSSSDIRNAVDKFLEGPFADTTKEFILCVSSPLEGTAEVNEFDAQRQRLAQRNIALAKWDGSEGGNLCEMLKRLPDLVDDFFGRPWVEEFNGMNAASSLGKRLDAVELGKLRPRLSYLYSVLFSQHDPGPLTTSGHTSDYSYRYVMADVVEAVGQRRPRANDPPEPLLSLVSNMETRIRASGGGDRRPDHLSRTAVEGESQSSFEARRPLTSWLKGQRNCVVLGEPGYGKSAMLRHLAISLLRQDDALAGQLEPEQLRRLPAWMSFAAFAAAVERDKNTSVEDYFREWLHRHGFDDVRDLFERSLHNSEVLLLVDGLDEAVTLGHARIALDRMVTFAHARGAAVVCTSRPRGFNALGVPGAWSSAHLAPFSDTQIREMSARWFALCDDDTSTVERFSDAMRRAQVRADTYLATVRANARTLQLARTPLLCQTLIELFRKSPRLPEERVGIYVDIISLILSRHPGSRARAADEASLGVNGDVGFGDLRKILIRLAAAMQSNGPTVVATTEYCEAVCAAYLQDDQEGLGRSKAEARRQAQTTIADLVTKFGMLVERAPQELGFVHLSIQEHLAAEEIAGRSEREQIDWVSNVWISPAWRECLVNWFGLQGSRGKKVFAGQAVARIIELGQTGEFERMQALQLCTELACSDLGIPVSDARRIVHQAGIDVEESPFSEHRMALARSLTVGALGSSVRDECSALIQKWTPGRPSLARAACLAALGSWGAQADLKATLVRGLLDEEGVCRRASAQSLVTVFGGDETLLPAVRGLALHHVRPEVRAAAVRALGLYVEWSADALVCANANLSTACAELLFEVVKVRVRQRKHDDEDLQRMSRLWVYAAMDFWQRDEFTNVLLEAWPRHPWVRETFIAQIRGRDGSRTDDDELLVYLMRAYPGDEEIANLLAGRFGNRGLSVAMGADRLWPPMRDGFRGHATLVPAIRAALSKYKREHERLYWHPNEIGAYMVLGDETARDELIDSYESTDDAYGKYWIARTLWDGWPTDAAVLSAMKTWARGSVDMSAPLAPWACELFSEVGERRNWLRKLATETTDGIVVKALHQLLDLFLDDETVSLIRARIESVGVWYYNRVNLESRIAATAPTEPRSLSLFERSLRELDGPPIAPWILSVENLSSLRHRVLAAAVPAAADVRRTIAATLHERMADHGSVTRLNPEYLAEASGAIRATVMSGLARAGRGEASIKSALGDVYVAELTSVGVHHQSRRCCGLAGLLEMDAAPLAAETLARTNQIDWTWHLVDTLEPDPVSLGAVVRHWHTLRPLLEARGLAAALPFSVIVSAGYGSILDQSPELSLLLDEYLTGKSSDWSEVANLELLAKRLPRSELLRNSLLEALARRESHHRTAPVAARLLAINFGGDPVTWESIKTAIASQNRGRNTLADGVLGFLACGWRDDAARAELGAMLPAEKSEWGVRDALLISVAQGDSESAEQTARMMLAEPLIDWHYKAEDAEALQEWAKAPIASEVLLRWTESADSTLSMTAIALVGVRQDVSLLNLAALRAKLNKQCGQLIAPLDGLDAVSRRTEGWCTNVYSTLAMERSV